MTSSRDDEPIGVALIGYGLAGQVFPRPAHRRHERVARGGDRDRRPAAPGPGARRLSIRRTASQCRRAVGARRPSASWSWRPARRPTQRWPPLPSRPASTWWSRSRSTTTADGARQLLALAAAHGVRLVPFLNRRWDSDHLTVQRLLRDGSLGSVFRYESRFDRWRPDARPGAWRDELHPPRGAACFSISDHTSSTRRSRYTDPSLRCTPRSPRGGAAPTTMSSSRSAPHRRGLAPLGQRARGRPRPRLRVLGSAGAYVVQGLDGQEDALRAGRRPTSGVRRGAARAMGPAAAWRRGAEVEPEGGRLACFYTRSPLPPRRVSEPPVSGRGAVAGLVILDAARESAATGTVVALQPRADDATGSSRREPTARGDGRRRAARRAQRGGRDRAGAPAHRRLDLLRRRLPGGAT